MKLKQIEKAQKFIETIKALDEDIIKLQQQAEKVAIHGTSIFIKLSSEKEQEKEKLKLDEDGSLISNGLSGLSGLYSFRIGSYHLGANEPIKDNSIEFLNGELSNRAALVIIGVLIEEKNAIRNQFITKLQSMGIEI